MSNITINQTIFLNTTLYGGVQPYDYCARWVGSYTASNGSTGLMPINPLVVANGVPYISSDGPCSVTPTKGSLTGLFEPNGFTGNINIWVYGKDAVGLEDISNVITYGVLSPGALVVNAGPDSIVAGPATSVNFTGATATGGLPPYTYSWSVPIGSSNPSSTTIQLTTDLQPTVLGFSQDGVYTYQILVTDNNGITGTDIKIVTASGYTPAPLPSTDVTICTQIWQKENLDVSTYRNGDVIPQVTDQGVWNSLTTGAWCYLDNNPLNGPIYGKLYNWYAVNDPRGLAPDGYHIPTDAEWSTLIGATCLAGVTVNPKTLRQAGLRWNGTGLWARFVSGTDDYGFSALPAQGRAPTFPVAEVWDQTFWWSSTESTTLSAWCRSFVVNYTTVQRFASDKNNGFSVRCIKD